MTVIAFPGHAGRCWPLARWRSLARIGELPRTCSPLAGDTTRAATTDEVKCCAGRLAI